MIISTPWTLHCIMRIKQNAYKAYLFPALLIACILLGGVTGCFFQQSIAWLKPLGTIFIHLILTTIVPLVFFSIAAAVARIDSAQRLERIFASMGFVFFLTGVIAASFALLFVKCFPQKTIPQLLLPNDGLQPTAGILDKLSVIFTVDDFFKLFSHHNMLALIIFALLVGVATSKATDERKKTFQDLLQAGEEIFMRVFSLVMYCAPIGFFAYFAVLIAELGPKLLDQYAHITLLYYGVASLYFVLMYSAYAYLYGGIQGIKTFWSNIFLPAMTAIATCSSAACIPASMAATKAMRIPSEVYETTIPLGTILHKDGSVIGGIMKIAFLFSLFQLDFSGFTVIMMAAGIGLMVGTVMGAIPSGGMLGELLILTAYGFPPSALIAIGAISIIIDPMATLLNVTGNCVSSMMIAKMVKRTD